MPKKRLYIDLVPVCRPFRSGVGFALTELLHALDDHAELHQTHDVIGFAPFDILPRAKELGLKNITLKSLPLPFKVMQALYKLRLLLPIDVWLGAGSYVFYDFRRWPHTKKSRSMVCVHDLTYKKYPQYCEPKNLRFLQKFVPLSVTKSERVVTISQAVKQQIIRELHVPEQKVGVVYPTVDASFERKTDGEVATAAKTYGLPQDPYFLVVGNQEPRKNIPAILQALKKMGEPQNVPPLVLFGGMAWNNDELAAQEQAMQTEGYRIVRPNKYVEDADMPAIISGALAVVTPSIYEGFSYPPLQAVLCQTPCIMAEDLPAGEVVGEYVVKVPAQAVDQLAAALHNSMQAGRQAITVDRAAILAKVGPQAVARQFVTELVMLEGR